MLLIGITLTAAVLVGGASTRATADQSLGASYPVDVTVQAGPTAFPADLSAQLTALPSVVHAAAVTAPDPDASLSAREAPRPLPSVRARLSSALDPSTTRDAAVRVLAASPAQSAVPPGSDMPTGWSPPRF